MSTLSKSGKFSFPDFLTVLKKRGCYKQSLFFVLKLSKNFGLEMGFSIFELLLRI